MYSRADTLWTGLKSGKAHLSREIVDMILEFVLQIPSNSMYRSHEVGWSMIPTNAGRQSPTEAFNLSHETWRGLFLANRELHDRACSIICRESWWRGIFDTTWSFTTPDAIHSFTDGLREYDAYPVTLSESNFSKFVPLRKVEICLDASLFICHENVRSVICLMENLMSRDCACYKNDTVCAAKHKAAGVVASHLENLKEFTLVFGFRELACIRVLGASDCWNLVKPSIEYLVRTVHDLKQARWDIEVRMQPENNDHEDAMRQCKDWIFANPRPT